MSTTTRARKPTKSRLSAEQIAVCEARALYETIKAATDVELGKPEHAVTDGMTDDAVEALYVRHEQILDAAGYYVAKDALYAAEKVVVAWCIEHAKRYSPDHASLLTDMHEKAKVSVVWWPRLVELAMRLAA